MAVKTTDSIIEMSWKCTKSLLKLLAIWPDRQYKFVRDKIIDIIHYYVIVINTIFQTLGMSVMCYVTYSDFITASESVGPMMGLYSSLGKICIYRYSALCLRDLFSSIENCVNNKQSKLNIYLEDYMKISSIACGVLHGSCIMMALGYLSLPLFASKRNIPFLSYYPWDWSNSTTLFLISYAHEMIITLLLANSNSTDFSYVWAICFCCARLRVIREKLEFLSTDDGSHLNDDELNEFMASIVKVHSDVYSDIYFINKTFTYIVVLIFQSAIIAICCAGLQMTTTSNQETNNSFLFILLASYYAGQLLFYYLPGEILAEEISAVGLAIYNCGWERLDIKYRKSINFMILKSWSPLRLFAGNLIPLRLENYTAFLATTASYFTSIYSITAAP